MMNKRSSLIILMGLIFLSFDTFGQFQNEDLQNTQISILTCRSGNELYSTFGHTGVRINNRELGIDQVYNYGLFSFNTSFFYLKFMRGKLPYLVGSTTMDSFLSEYQFDKRSVFEQILNLNIQQKKKLIEFLIENTKPENREYKYDFFHDNCATRIVDVYSLVNDSIKYSNEVESKSFRALLKENLQSLVWSDFGIDLVIGSRADRIANRRGQMFLPEYVMHNLEHAELIMADTIIRLAQSPILVLDFESLNAERKQKSTNWPLICTLIILLLTVVVNLMFSNYAAGYNKSLLLLSGIMGCFLLFMWFGTDHKATRDNWNIIWLNPLLLIMLYLNKRMIQYLSYLIFVCLFIAALNSLFTFLPQFFNLAFLPVIGSIAIAVIYMNRKNRMEAKK